MFYGAKKPGTRAIPIKERFWAKVNKHTSTGCWEWMASLTHFGYGQFNPGYEAEKLGKEKSHKAHRTAWEITNGVIPKGMCVLHRCDNPKCVNPDHLFLGTKKDNTQDAVRKGRMLVGEKNGMSKLTKEIILEIRKKAEEGIPQKKLAEIYGVKFGCVSKIVLRTRWKTI